MYEVKLEKYTVSEILSKDFSDYVLPLIQREYVWDSEDVKEMVESLLKGYPIGIITLIKTDIELPYVPLVDSNENDNRNKKEKYFILDGQQRLTSLILIKEGWRIKRRNETIEIKPIFYNPDDGKLRTGGKNPIGYDFSRLIRQCTFKEEAEAGLSNILAKLRDNFLNRPIAFYIIEVNKDKKSEEEIYRDMAEIFTRINRAGIRLGNLEMFLSFFASTGLGKEEITDLYREMNNKYGMDLEPIIRFVFSNLGLSQSQISKVKSFRKAIEDIRKKYDKNEVSEVISKCREAIIKTMDILYNELGITSTQILPSETALVPIFQYIYQNNGQSISNFPIIKWFILASFNGIYSSRTDTRLEHDLKIIKTSRDAFPFDNLLDSMRDKINKTEIEERDIKNIEINILRGVAGKKYIFLLYTILFKNGATDWAGRPLNKINFKDLSKHHIFPKEELRERGEDEVMINHLGNLTFIYPSVNEEINDRLPSEYLYEFDENVLEKHLIPLNEDLWKIENYYEFLDKRMELIWNKYCEFFKI